METLEQYIGSIKRFGRITHLREKELSKIILHSKDSKKINKAREELIQSNLLLVVKIAMNVKAKYPLLPIMDLISEGNLGLISAANIYVGDHDSGASFGTYAFKSIKRRIMDVVKAERFMYLPGHYINYRNQLNVLKDQYGDDLTDEIIFRELNISKKMLKSLKDDKNKRVVLLDDTIAGDDGVESIWSDIIEDTKMVMPSEESAKVSLMEFLNKYIAKLNPRERDVIKERELVNSPLTYEDISGIMKISTERIRQIHYAALRKLKRLITGDWQKKHGHNEVLNEKYIDLYGERQKIYNKTFKHLLSGNNE